MPAARSEVIPGTAHDPQVTHPSAYTAAVESIAGHRDVRVSQPLPPAQRR